ncbi:hypothetical protein [Mediterranea massiliensis]|uniref:hypothetical protein n=1 Tax=Mediterranea massiliensis TaxID=1841865 RepID=UPI0025A39D92|nr:hypothetical protein [Mediterranea massiliensis]MDM8337513.1 hypothetical protein [Mediterranea massiliensis]
MLKKQSFSHAGLSPYSCHCPEKVACLVSFTYPLNPFPDTFLIQCMLLTLYAGLAGFVVQYNRFPFAGKKQRATSSLGEAVSLLWISLSDAVARYRLFVFPGGLFLVPA